MDIIQYTQAGFHSLWHNLPHLLWLGIDLLVTRVIIKLLAAHYATHVFEKWADPWLAKTERRVAIRLHYLNRGQKTGHASRSVSSCEEGKCALIGSTVSLPTTPFTK